MPHLRMAEAILLGAIGVLLCVTSADTWSATASESAGLATDSTSVCLGADWGCHFWTNADGSVETIYYQVVTGKYEFDHDQKGQLIPISYEHSPPPRTTDDGLYQCQLRTRPSLCTPVDQALRKSPSGFGPSHKYTLDSNSGREDFWTLPEHQTLTDISDPAVWSRVKGTAPQYRPYDAVNRGIELQSMLSIPNVNTGVCLGADWGCHSWTNPDGSRENFNYQVILGKYEFAHDKNGQLIPISHEHSPPLHFTEDGLYQCRVQLRPTLCAVVGHEAGVRTLQFGPEHKRTINNSHGLEYFWTLPGHQSLTEVVDAKQWAALEAKAPQYDDY